MESEQTWRKLEIDIKCPLKPPNVCKKGVHPFPARVKNVNLKKKL